MAGLRERKKRATRHAIHAGAMRLFAEQGFDGTTIDEIAEAANVSRATVFSYFPTKEELVFGDTSSAIDSLAAALHAGAERDGTIGAFRAWLGELTGWIDPELVLRQRLAREVPGVAARRLAILAEIEQVIADAFERELGPGRQLAARLSAASMVAALRATEESTAAAIEQHDRVLSDSEIATLLDDAVTFAQAGISALVRH